MALVEEKFIYRETRKAMPIMQQLNSLGIDSDDIISLHAMDHPHCKGRLGRPATALNAP